MSIQHRTSIDQYGFEFIVCPDPPLSPTEVAAGRRLIAEMDARHRLIGYEHRLYGRSIDECWSDAMINGYIERMAEEAAEAIAEEADQYQPTEDDLFWLDYEPSDYALAMEALEDTYPRGI